MKNKHNITVAVSLILSIIIFSILYTVKILNLEPKQFIITVGIAIIISALMLDKTK